MQAVILILLSRKIWLYKKNVKEMCALRLCTTKITIIREFTYFKCKNNNHNIVDDDVNGKSHILKSLHCAIFICYKPEQVFFLSLKEICNVFISLLTTISSFEVACEFFFLLRFIFQAYITSRKKYEFFCFLTFRQFCYSLVNDSMGRDTFAVAMLLKSIIYSHSGSL